MTSNVEIDDCFKTAKPAAANAFLLSLGESLGEIEARLLAPQPIFEQCGFLQAALLTGGKDYDQPLWHLSILSSVFMEGGNEIAHKISKLHPTYDYADTQAMYERKVADRADRGVGYPSCRAIEGAGCKSCASCPLQGKISSPLNLANVHHQISASHGADAPACRWVDPLDFSVVPAGEAVDRINAAGFFVLTSNGDIYREAADGTVAALKTTGFTTLLACRKVPGENGLVTAHKVWLSSPLRREYARIGYWPGDHNVPPKSYNLWHGWGIQPARGDWSVIERHVLEVVAGGDQKKSDFIFDWCAHMVQRPREKPGVALVLRGRKGTGKTLLTQLIVRCIGDRNALVTANGKQLFGQFNWHLADKLLIVAEEAFFVGNHELNDRLKHLVTGDTFEAEQKFGQRVSMKSMHRVIMASNHDQVVAATDDERRFVVCDVSDARRGDDAYFAPLVKIVKGQDDATLAAFMHHLHTRDISDFKPERAARTAGKRDLARQKLLGLEPPLQWLLEVALAPEPISVSQLVFDVSDVGAPPAAHQDILAWFKDKAKSSEPVGLEWSRQQALQGYRMWVKMAHIRGAGEYTGAAVFWNSIKRLINSTIFPGRKLFRNSGGERYVCLPPRRDLIEGFNRLLGGDVIGLDDDPI